MLLVILFALLFCAQNVMFCSGSSLNNQLIRIGTRGSPLALVQANNVKQLIETKYPTTRVEIKEIMTKGDAILDQALGSIGGKGLFVKELDVALLNNDVDICVHSMKDVPTTLVDGTILPCVLPREVTNDVFISTKYESIADVPDGATIGSASLRRKSQLLQMNPTWNVINFRGNVQTRLKKLKNGDVDGTMLALAGLKRLNMDDLIKNSEVIPFKQMLPAVAQGAIGIQCRDYKCKHDGCDAERDKGIVKMLKGLNHPHTMAAIGSERKFLASLDGNCRTPIAAQVKFRSSSKKNPSEINRMLFNGLIAKPDGADMIKVALDIPVSQTQAKNLNRFSEDIGAKVGSMIKNDILGEELFQEYQESFHM